MAVGKCRFLYDDLVVKPATIITPNSWKRGQILAPLKSGTGSAILTPEGIYSYGNDLEYTIVIDSITAGTGIGQATYKWKTSQNSGWAASGVATSSVATALNNGVTIKWTAGGTFALNDTWYFKAINRFSGEKLRDYNRDTSYRSGDVTGTKTIVFDMMSAMSANSIIIYDHNFTSAATITLEANATDSWGTPAFTETIPWATLKILRYLAATPSYRYFRLSITDSSNPDGYIEIGELFLGEYMELTRTALPQFSQAITLAITEGRNRYNAVRKRFHNFINRFDGTLQFLTDADIVKLDALVSGIADRELETIRPIYFNLNANDTSVFHLMEWVSYDKRLIERSANVNYYAVSLTLSEASSNKS